ncbi:DNA alkylation repair protein [Duganella violaceipulchra]|uniref:3-methyladenine DNA glycosylase AlkD n=1 Tax=Duganella violaceipulchra TaxID=2849652 RepID=A0AA41HI79_9BURK|nr:DNA alkylation repair protein [Duganella violaceicalia]MBV6324278.1 DNA alkylation repair protein [Duganella violaceicalia]MCP2007333.1 3-methyladenine DNA glycosylase AlkD [Duganella violaceicalia]
MNPEFRSALDFALTCAATPGRAPAMRAYMRGQFDFLGVATPQRRLAARTLLQQLKGTGADNILHYAHELWKLPQREYQYVAVDLLAMHNKQLELAHIPPLLELVQSKSWWDTVDALASVISDVLHYRHDGMDRALSSENMWVRRVALLHQLGWRDKVDIDRLFAYSLALAHEKEFFIQKALGWALRDYARFNPDAVRAFTLNEKQRLSALSYREANKHLI